MNSTDGSSVSKGKLADIHWMDLLWLLLLAILALLPPVVEIHKQLTLLAIGIVQVSEAWLLSKSPQRGAAYIVLLKIALATLLIDHTGEIGINSSYWPVFFLPVVTAAEYFNPWATLGWTALASAAYCSYLYPALQEYEITAESYGLLGIRILFFFLAAMVVNRFVVENRRQIKRYQDLAETLAETNRRLEQAQADARRSERLAALGQMSAGLAHEIRNPLGVIKGSVEILHQKLGEANPLATEMAGYISSETNRLSALVTRFLDFARPLQMELSPQPLAPLLDRALRAVTMARKEKNNGHEGSVAVEKNYQPNLPEVPLDEDLCEQAFVNLIDNAYDAMGSSGGILRVGAARNVEGERDGIEVRIEDSGPGIPPELREQIFNPFVTTKKSGVGLGLSIVSRIIDGHHGTIRVESGVHGHPGASFVMFSPAATVEEVHS
ncbi:MAG TPA: ATP-binding protein [Candidatus Binatia bacterium]|nr:ATP-binding protein [Candidatus Binatia bacterium]